MLVDPDGRAPDDFISRDGKYLGSSGSGNDIRMMENASDFSTQKSYDELKSLSNKVEVQSGQTEFIDNLVNSSSNGNEHGALITLNSIDIKNPKLSFGPVIEGNTEAVNFQFGRTASGFGDIPKGTVVSGDFRNVVIGAVHSHTDKMSPGVSTISNSKGGNDVKTAKDINGPNYAVDKNNVHKVDQNSKINNNMNRSTNILIDALKTKGGF